jgi:hypothetical protein
MPFPLIRPSTKPKVAPPVAQITLPAKAPVQAPDIAVARKPDVAPPVANVRTPAAPIIKAPVRIGCFCLNFTNALPALFTTETAFLVTFFAVFTTNFLALLAVVQTFL